jgi:hypothetical protein
MFLLGLPLAEGFDKGLDPESVPAFEFFGLGIGEIENPAEVGELFLFS